MDWKQVKSSMLTHIAHDGDTLHLRYKGGREYSHKGVPKAKFDALLASESKGEYFNKHIKPHHPATKR